MTLYHTELPDDTKVFVLEVAGVKYVRLPHPIPDGVCHWWYTLDGSQVSHTLKAGLDEYLEREWVKVVMEHVNKPAVENEEQEGVTLLDLLKHLSKQ